MYKGLLEMLVSCVKAENQRIEWNFAVMSDIDISIYIRWNVFHMSPPLRQMKSTTIVDMLLVIDYIFFLYQQPVL